MAGHIQHRQRQPELGQLHRIALSQRMGNARNLFARRAEHRYLPVLQQISDSACMVAVMVSE